MSDMTRYLVLWACVNLGFIFALSTAQDVPCVCVWFYQCPNGTLEKHGVGLIDIRGSIKPICNETGFVCCPVEEGQITETATLPTEENETEPKLPTTADLSVIDPLVDSEISEPKPLPVIVPQPGCGVKRASLDQRISFSSIDDSIASFAEFPWMLAILTEKTPMSYHFKCGASLIHKQVALTAAHCVDRLPAGSLRIRAGEWNTKKNDEPLPHQDRKVRHVELHPFYRYSDLSHDIALIYLDYPFNLTDNVDTICLPDPGTIFHGRRCEATGWGRDPANPNGTYHSILHKVDLPVVPRAECENRLRETKLGPYFKLHHSFLCAGGEPEKDSCKGDGGGPLVCPTDDDNRWVQAGIVSWGVGCGTTTPGVYTDVSAHSIWIHRRLQRLQDRKMMIPPYHHFYRYPY